MQSYEIGANEAGQRFDKFLHKFMPTAGTGFLYKMLRKKNIVLNGKKAEGKEILTVGDTVSFFFSEETYEKFTGIVSSETKKQPDLRDMEIVTARKNKLEEYQNAYRRLKGISVIYEDADILIVNKPAGVLTQKAEQKDISLNEWMIGYLLTNNKLSAESLFTFKPSVANRLDRNTSGLVLCGISLSGSQLLAGLIHDRLLGKYYVTVVKGRVEKEALIEGYLTKDNKTNKVSVITDSGAAAKTSVHTDTNAGKSDAAPIKTAYRPLAYGRDCTCLEIHLITGKTHQIRAHMASIGHPVVGDTKYGNEAFNEKYRRTCQIKHQLLHAMRIEFPTLTDSFAHLSGRIFTAPLPDAFEEVFTYGNMEFPRS